MTAAAIPSWGCWPPDSDLSPGFDPVEEWLVDFDPTMSSELEAKSLGPSKRTRFHRHTRFSRRSPTPLLRTFTVPMKKYSNEVWYGSLLASPHFRSLLIHALGSTVFNNVVWISLQILTLGYKTPEFLLGTTHYSMSVDMWSVGCIFGKGVMFSKVIGWWSVLQNSHLDMNLFVDGSWIDHQHITFP
jgi:hypothetical protein